MIFGFWFIAGLLLLLPLSVILLILLRKQDDAPKHHTALYQQRLNELRADIENELLSETDAEKVKRELQLSLLNQNKTAPQTKNKSQFASPAITAILLLILVPAFVIGFYHYTGQPDFLLQETLLSELNQAKTVSAKRTAIEKMLGQIEKKLRHDPDDVHGWLILFNSYSTLKRYPDALRTIEQLYRLKGDDPTVLLSYANILLIINEGNFTDKSTALINDALMLDPENAQGLWLAVTAANKRGDIEEAAQYWQRLIPQLETEPALQQKIKQYIQLANTGMNSVEDELENINAELGSETLPTEGHGITIQVSLADTLLNEVNSDDTLFIYAKAIDGSPVPLALLQQTASALPLQVILDNSMAMVPNNRLSDHAEVQLIARISKNGHAKPKTGDLIGRINTVSTNRDDVINLIINHKIQ